MTCSDVIRQSSPTNYNVGLSFSDRLMRRLLLTLACLPFVAHAETEQPTEAWQAKGQATYIGQHSSSFRSPYNGRNSLNGAGEDAYTFTSTAFLGARLWQGGEAYLNIEASQGDAMSGLTGLGGL